MGTSEAPGELTGNGPTPASMARRLAPGSVMRRLLTEPVTGKLLHYGITTYVAPANLAAQVMVRDGTCRAPGCGLPAADCDLDHTVPFPQGHTCADNLGAVAGIITCVKTAGVWSVVQEDGVFTVRTATGQQRTVPTVDLGEALRLMRQAEDETDAASKTLTPRPDRPSHRVVAVSQRELATIWGAQPQNSTDMKVPTSVNPTRR